MNASFWMENRRAKMGGIVVADDYRRPSEPAASAWSSLITTLLDPAAVTGDGYLGDIYRFPWHGGTGQFTIIMLLAIIAAFIVKNIFSLFSECNSRLRFVYTNQFTTSVR